MSMITTTLPCCVSAQVQKYVRGRSVRKRRDKLKAEGRAQSVPRDEMLPYKVRHMEVSQVRAEQSREIEGKLKKK